MVRGSVVAWALAGFVAGTALLGCGPKAGTDAAGGPGSSAVAPDAYPMDGADGPDAPTVEGGSAVSEPAATPEMPDPPIVTEDETATGAGIPASDLGK